MKFVVWIVSEPEDEHWRGLEDVARGVARSLVQLGHKVEYVGGGGSISATSSRLLVFNAHRLSSTARLPDDAIIYNAEQVRDWSSVVGRLYLERLRRHVVWDYSATNIARLRELGVMRVVHCRVGYVPQPEIVRATQQDVDVLFFGSTNTRRALIAFDLSVRGLRVETLFGVYGAERDAWIARSKIVINVHFYPSPIFEIFRCAHLFTHKKCVVTEDSGVDPELEALARNACAYVDYKGLVDECERLVKNPIQREAQALAGYRFFIATDQTAEVDKALEAS